MTQDSPNAIHRIERHRGDALEDLRGADSRGEDLSRHVQRLFDDRNVSPDCGRPNSASRYLPDCAPPIERGDSGPPRLGGVVDQLTRNPSRLLLDSSSSPEDRLAAVRELSKSGTSTIQVHGNDGQNYTMRLEREQAGSREMVHLFIAGADGKEHTVLRGIADQQGNFSQEQNRHGKPVSWYGAGAQVLQNALSDQSQNRSGVCPPLDGNRDAPWMQPDREHPWDSPNWDRPWMPPDHNNPWLRPDQQHPWTPPDDDRRWQRPDQQHPWTPPDDDRRWQRPDSGNQQIIPDQQEQQRPRPFDVPPEQNAAQVLDSSAQDANNRARQLIQTSAGIYMRTGMTIDADGSPRARQIDPDGQLNTSMRYADNKSLNAEVVPYMVLPGGAYQKFGVKLGDMVLVRNKENGRMAIAVFGDVGPRNKTGEGSMALAQEVGLNPSPTHGGTSNASIEYLVLPNTHGNKPQNEQELMARIAEQRRRFGLE